MPGGHALSAPGGGHCINTHGWRNQYGVDCDAYRSKQWCNAGELLESWSGGEAYRWPEHHCCECGKAKPSPWSPPALDPDLAPHFLILGAQKAATTSVYELLKRSNLVCGRGALPLGDYREKEAHFFDQFEGVFNATSRKDYLDYYRHQPGCSRFMDATPNYLFQPDVPARMVRLMSPEWVSSVRMIAVLREPIARDLSVYNMAKSLWWEAGKKDSSTKLGPIEGVLCKYDQARNRFPTYKEACMCMVQQWEGECLPQAGGDHVAAYSRCSAQLGPPWRKSNRLANGMYLPQVENFVRHFSRHQLLVVSFEQLTNRQPEHIRSILAYLNLPQSHHLTELPAANSKPFPGKVAKMDCATRDALWRIYEPFNTGLYKYLVKHPGLIPQHEKELGGFTEFTRPVCEEGELQLSESDSESEKGAVSMLAL